MALIFPKVYEVALKFDISKKVQKHKSKYFLYNFSKLFFALLKRKKKNQTYSQSSTRTALPPCLAHEPHLTDHKLVSGTMMMESVSERVVELMPHKTSFRLRKYLCPYSSFTKWTADTPCLLFHMSHHRLQDAGVILRPSSSPSIPTPFLNCAISWPCLQTQKLFSNCTILKHIKALIRMLWFRIFENEKNLRLEGAFHASSYPITSATYCGYVFFHF